MNQSQIHLALTHLPVILTLTGAVVLAISLVLKNSTVTKVSFYILLFAGLFALPVFFTGEGAEETVEHLPGVSGSMIEQHENIANFSFYVVIGAALLALVGLLKTARMPVFNTVRYFVLVAAFIASGLMVWTAHLGGQIRHTEIAQASVATEQNQQEHEDEE